MRAEVKKKRRKKKKLKYHSPLKSVSFELLVQDVVSTSTNILFRRRRKEKRRTVSPERDGKYFKLFEKKKKRNSSNFKYIHRVDNAYNFFFFLPFPGLIREQKGRFNP